MIRKTIFWIHLVTGLIAGISIGIMSFTGAILAFEHEIVEWAERDARRVEPPSAESTGRLPLDEILRQAGEGRPELRSPSITLRNDPAAAVAVSAGRDGGVFVNPYTGEVREPESTRMHDFMHVMIAWHRYLGREGESRGIGKAINGACNIAFCALAVTGLYIWWPRSWSWRGLKAITVFNWSLAGKARDFNWHNSIGFWASPVLIVLTLTAVPISYRWGGNLIYRIAGEEPPVQGQGGPGGASGPAVEIVRPSPDVKPIGYDAIVSRIQTEFPDWEQISLRSGSAQRRPRAAAAGGESGSAAATPSAEPRARSESGEGRAAPQPITVSIRESGSWPRTAVTTLTLNPFSGEELRREAYASLSTARKIRSWTRFLHTGEALGFPGQLAAGLASLGGVFLVYTGFALSWRRFFGRRRKPVVSSPGAATAAAKASGNT